MNQTNCHNCGAPITGPKCEYCGTRFNIRVEEDLELKLVDLRRDMIQQHVNEVLIRSINPNDARRRMGLREI